MRNLKKVLSLALAMVMLLGMMVVGASAADATEYPDYGEVSANKQEAVQVITALSVMDGTEKGMEPQSNLNRAMAATIIARTLLGRTVADALSSSTCVFTDVPDWAKGAVQYCADMGIVYGIGNNKFGSLNNVKGTEFAAMLLRAVDPDGDYSGESWASKVIVAANKNGLSKNIPVTATELNREGAAQMAFNTIVDYSPSGATGYVVNGINNVFDSWFEAYIANGGAGGDVSNIHTAKNDTLAKTVFGLSETKNTDKFGRDFKAWKLDGEDDPIVVTNTYVTAPTVTYTKGGVSANDVTKATGASTSAVAANKVYTNSIDAGTGANVNVEGLCKNGRTVEVYASNKAIDKVIVVDEYIGTVSRVNAAKGDTKRSVTVGGRSFTTEEFEKDDVVLYTMADGKIASMKLAEVMEGVSVTSYREDRVSTTDGNYNYHNGFTPPEWSFTGTYTLYLDSFKYVAMQKAETASESASQYALVTGIRANGFTEIARLVLSDGSTEQVTLTDDSWVPSASGDRSVAHLVSFTTDDDGHYKLADASKAGTAAYTANDVIVESGKALVKLSNTPGNTINATNNTLFFVKTDTNKYSVYQGLTNVPTLKATDTSVTIANIVKDKVAAAVYVDGTSNVDSSAASEASYIFVLGNDSKKINDATLGEHYVYTAVVDGEVNTEFKVEDHITSEMVFSSVSYDSKTGVAAMGTDVTSDSKKVGYEKPVGGVMVIGGKAYTYTDDDTLLFYIEDGTLSDSHFDSIQDADANDDVWVIANNKDEASVIVIKAKTGGTNIKDEIPSTGDNSTVEVKKDEDLTVPGNVEGTINAGENSEVTIGGSVTGNVTAGKNGTVDVATVGNTGKVTAGEGSTVKVDTVGNGGTVTAAKDSTVTVGNIASSGKVEVPANTTGVKIDLGAEGQATVGGEVVVKAPTTGNNTTAAIKGDTSNVTVKVEGGEVTLEKAPTEDSNITVSGGKVIMQEAPTADSAPINVTGNCAIDISESVETDKVDRLVNVTSGTVTITINGNVVKTITTTKAARDGEPGPLTISNNVKVTVTGNIEKGAAIVIENGGELTVNGEVKAGANITTKSQTGFKVGANAVVNEAITLDLTGTDIDLANLPRNIAFKISDASAETKYAWPDDVDEHTIYVNVTTAGADATVGATTGHWTAKVVSDKTGETIKENEMTGVTVGQLRLQNFYYSLTKPTNGSGSPVENKTVSGEHYTITIVGGDGVTHTCGFTAWAGTTASAS